MEEGGHSNIIGSSLLKYTSLKVLEFLTISDDFYTGLSGTKVMSPSLSVPGNQPGPFQNAAKKSDQVFIDEAFPQTLPK